ncbi:hypothetical protein [Lysinibacillus sp. GbtcB16]|uniref:hypothetical protein n=1 Tax=Lysinibacillus sp. GbtcB16 TaxID=2824761 RepID=UPI001C2FE482|nr:hypothetical protein [Lysinibacillus sp. GbtcB16]
MSFRFGKFVKEEISHQSLQNFMKNYGKSYSHRKEDLFQKIEAELNSENPAFTETAINDLIKEEIKYGSRRSLFLAKFSFADAKKINTVEKATAFLFNITGKKSMNLNTLNSIESNNFKISKDLNTEYISLITNDKQVNVNSIDICFTYFSEITVKDKEKNQAINQVKEYIWVNIDIRHRNLIIRIHPPQNDIFGKNYSAIQLFNSIRDLLSETINFKEMISYQEMLYDLFKNTTDVSEKPFRDRIKTHTHLIEPFIKNVSQEKLFSNEKYNSLLNERIVDLMERILIQDNFKEYIGYAEGKVAVLNKMHFKDGTGASVQASSGSKNGDTLELSDVFFDTRKSIEKEQKLKTLWIDWFKIDDTNKENIAKIKTKFETANEYLLIHFLDTFLIKEDQEYVFSKLREYDTFNWDR